MTGSPPLQRSRRVRILRLCVLGVVFSPILALLVWFALFRLTNANAISRLEGRIRQRGEPMNLAQLAAKYPSIPDSENAAVALLELWEKDAPEFWQAYLRGEKSLPQRTERKVPPALPFLGAESPRRLARPEP